MCAAMRLYSYWVVMAADVVSYVSKCDSCAGQRVHPLARRWHRTLLPATVPSQDTEVDLYGPLDRTAAGHRFILVITDLFTKLVRAIPMHVARGPYRVVSTNGPAVLLDVDGEHRRENVPHVVRASGAAVAYAVQHPALREALSIHGAKADGQRSAVDRIADHVTFPDGTLRVQVYWTG